VLIFLNVLIFVDDVFDGRWFVLFFMLKKSTATHSPEPEICADEALKGLGHTHQSFWKIALPI
jgi:hypothetical protein